MAKTAARENTDEQMTEETLETSETPEASAETGTEENAEAVEQTENGTPGEMDSDEAKPAEAEENGSDMVNHLKEKLKENEDKYLRLVAEFENFKRRSTQEAQRRFKFASQGLALNIIEGLDNLELALQHARDEESEQMKKFVSGIEMVQQQLYDALKKSNIERIFPLKEAFDPNRHEALSVIASEEIEPGHVAAVFKAGYIYHDRVIRPAAVQVVKNDN